MNRVAPVAMEWARHAMALVEPRPHGLQVRSPEAHTLLAHAREPTAGYAPVNDLSMYYEIHGSGDGEPLVLLHGSFMTISSNWTGWIEELTKTRNVIAVDMQGHGRTADIDRHFSSISL